jgi:hypothetical protein
MVHALNARTSSAGKCVQIYYNDRTTTSLRYWFWKSVFSPNFVFPSETNLTDNGFLYLLDNPCHKRRFIIHRTYEIDDGRIDTCIRMRHD